jgi:ribosomal protein S18 acetylase RimI-like enzyme
MRENISAGRSKSQIIQATPEDFDRLADFLNLDNLIYRHLDWFGVLDWLGHQAFLIEHVDDEIQAFLCVTPENDDTAWVRAFGVRKVCDPIPSWQRLFNRSIQILTEKNIRRIAGLGLHPWFTSLLEQSNFVNRQNIVVLEWQNKLPSSEPPMDKFKIRLMKPQDLEEVAKVDKIAFPSLWQNSLEGLKKAFNLMGVSTVATQNEKIIGYQISTTMTIYGHLARLAVLPNHQRQGVAFSLVYDLLQKFDERGLWRVTVNTQSDNKPSLKLYKKFGFKKTKEEIPAYELNL